MKVDFDPGKAQMGGLMANVGPARPDEQNTRPWPTTGVGITSRVLPMMSGTRSWSSRGVRSMMRTRPVVAAAPAVAQISLAATSVPATSSNAVSSVTITKPSGLAAGDLVGPHQLAAALGALRQVRLVFHDEDSHRAHSSTGSPPLFKTGCMTVL